MPPTLEELARALGAIHEAACDEQRWPDALRQIAALFEAPKAALLDVDAAQERLLRLASFGHDPAARHDYEAHYCNIDPSLQLVMSANPHTAMLVYEQFPAAVRARSEYFDFARRWDIGDVMGLSTRGASGVRSMMSLQRSVKGVGFDADAKRIFELLAPHLETAKRVQARLAQSTAQASALASGLDRLAHAAFIVDAGAAIRHMNAAARALLSRDRRLRTARGRLSFGEPRLQAAFGAAVRAAAAKGGRSRVLALAPVGEIALAPLHETHALGEPWQQPLVLVMVSFPPRDARAIAARMREVYGLSPAEARVVSLLATGEALEDIALAHGVAESTLRSQLRSIRAKTGTRRQAELVRLALGGAPLAPDAG